VSHNFEKKKKKSKPLFQNYFSIRRISVSFISYSARKAFESPKNDSQIGK